MKEYFLCPTQKFFDTALKYFYPTVSIYLLQNLVCKCTLVLSSDGTVHTGSFDWFLSGLEWVLNLEFCLQKLLIFYQKLLLKIKSRLNSSTFWVFEPLCLIKIEALCTKNEDFYQTYLNTGSKTQNVEEFGLDLLFHNNFW